MNALRVVGARSVAPECFFAWILVWCFAFVPGSAAWAFASSSGPHYLYQSPATHAFFAANGANYDALTDRWRTYLRRSTTEFREVSRPQLLAGLAPGVLVLGSAILLDDQERAAITRYAEAGGSVLLTWGTGARDGTGRWVGYGFLETMLDMRVTGKVALGSNERFLQPFGDGPLTWPVPVGERIFLGEVAETPVRVQSANLAARYVDWQRFPQPPETNGAIAFLEKGASRRVYLGFAESSWDYDERKRLSSLLDGAMAWLQRQPTVSQASWPNGHIWAHTFVMDVEDGFANAEHFASHLEQFGLRGSFFAVTGAALGYRSVLERLVPRHEIGYLGDAGYGFKGKPKNIQKGRLEAMVADMKNVLGSRLTLSVTGFRAPAESWDATTEQLLRPLGIRHHVAGPGACETRVPCFSQSEPNLGPEQALVVLPRTQGDDLTYLGLKLDTETLRTTLQRDAEYQAEAGALGVLAVHSQHYSPQGSMATQVPAYLQRIRQQKTKVWAATSADIAQWWRMRERVSFLPGPLLQNRFTFTVRAPGQVRGLTFVITHPARDRTPRRVLPNAATMPQPELVRIDAWRSAIVFRQELGTGHYGYSVEF
ncbi:hypothetical protein [Candidatus Symbiobacter mobilis]|uniref:NodB homology domain-containing protein n=1 Tax=Candidatus Symbiobacter mobilis CR TaxID=946483 RepID=U5N8H7_9BURK|nr:hypothetical protein [Candidatus Symbiobacter mobilis]AGX86573.1 hypothetical protein Cenrod_0456 [Candidatus Symbiobacter mobilis CR]